MSNPIWDYSLALYADAAVAEACLAAQDDCGMDINLVLYAGWLASRQLSLTPDHLRGADRAVREWRTRVIQPLRALRRDWRGLAEAAALRSSIGELELAAERREQEQLWDYHQRAEPLPAAGDVLDHNLRCLLATSLGSEQPWQAHHSALLAAFARAGAGG